MSKTYSEMLIERGIYPGKKKYECVKPRGIYKLLPNMWRKAKQLEQATDFTYDILMNEYEIARYKYSLTTNTTASQSAGGEK